jgi:putative peptide maturation dehydrogenase
MARVRRTRHLVVCCQDTTLPDIAALLRGVARVVTVEETYAISLLRGERHVVSNEDLGVLLSIPSGRWIDGHDLDRATLDRFTAMGLVLADDGTSEHAELIRRDAELDTSGWNLFGALYHFLTRWRDVNVDAPLEDIDLDLITEAMADAVEQFVARHGSAPTALFALDDPLAVHELPLVERHGGLYDALAARRTTRGFDSTATMTAEQLAAVLFYVFGCHGWAPMAGNGIMIRRTSPSGGGLHPIEAYPLVAGVAGIDDGLYHYNVRDHALELVATIDAEEAARLAREFMCGQTYFASAQAKILMTARFERSFWKYRRHPKAYAALMMDAGHLSQTLYLVAAELGLGAFVTAAVNGANIEERLGLDGTREGVLAACGCGVRSARSTPLEPEYRAYVPRRSELPPEAVAGARATTPTPDPAERTTAG